MNDNQTNPLQIRSRKRHQYREAENTLKYIIEQIEGGYGFDDEFGPRLLDEMRKICVFMRKEYNELTLLAPPSGDDDDGSPLPP